LVQKDWALQCRTTLSIQLVQNIGQVSVSWAVDELEQQSLRKQRDAEELHDTMLHLNAELSKGQPGFDRSILNAMVYRWMKVASDAALLKL